MAESRPRISSLAKRIAVAVFFVPIISFLFFHGRTPFVIFLAGVMIIGQFELFQMFGDHLRIPHRIFIIAGGMVLFLSAIWKESFAFSSTMIIILVLSFLIEILSGRERRFEAVILSLFSTVYPAISCRFLYRLSMFSVEASDEYLRYTLIFVTAATWMFDSGSYFVGRSFGKRLLCPSVSPKKTVEGFIGGVLTVLVVALVAILLTRGRYFAHIFALSSIAVIAGQIGDLAESLIKRDFSVKDASKLLPGHGGILDRFDSLFFAGPLSYIYIESVVRAAGGLL